MHLIRHIKDMKNFVEYQKGEGRSIGFIPTMGYLHKGHVSLIMTSLQNNDTTIVSIFVNPIQFGESEDFGKYPRDMARDLAIAADAGVDVVFAPEVDEMYPPGFKAFVNVTGITQVMCGKSRPGHFQGVTTVVSKLFNIIRPDRAYFGQKDAQQVAVIKKMVEDLNMNIEVVACPTVRESDGLAISSRNVYLNQKERKAAAVLPGVLAGTEALIAEGERSSERLIRFMDEKLRSIELIEIDYIEIRDALTFEEIEKLAGKVLVAAALKIGNTRLIDNIMVEVK